MNEINENAVSEVSTTEVSSVTTEVEAVKAKDFGGVIGFVAGAAAVGGVILLVKGGQKAYKWAKTKRAAKKAAKEVVNTEDALNEEYYEEAGEEEIEN